jgi:hypothetical protein
VPVDPATLTHIVRNHPPRKSRLAAAGVRLESAAFLKKRSKKLLLNGAVGPAGDRSRGLKQNEY